MAGEQEIFWGKTINPTSQSETKTVMQRQAVSLGKITNNIVEADVSTSIIADEGDGFRDLPSYNHCFDVIAPILDYQRFTLFCATQKMGNEFPISLYSNYWGSKKQCNCIDLESFKECLKQILSSEETGKLINSIIQQSA